MTSLKLKYKIEILHNLIKSNPSDFAQYRSKTFHEERPKSNIKSFPHKPSFKNLNSNNYESLPGYEKEFSKLTQDEKEETINLMKTINFQNLTLIFQTLNRNQFYKKIKSKIGLGFIKNSFMDIINLKTGGINLEGENSSENLLINDECEFFFSFKDVLNITELDSMDLFDLFKYNEYFAVTEQNFIVIIYMFAAYEDGEFTDFINIFYEDLFYFISGGKNMISVVRLKELAKILGLIEFDKSTTKMNLELSSLIDVEKFKEFYLNLGRQHDNLIKSEGDYYTVITESQNVKQKHHHKDGRSKDYGAIHKNPS
jgi:hypothetical protein